jgi:hypothetical protein
MSCPTRRLSLGLFLIAFLAYGLIFSGVGNGNTVPRIALTLAMVENGSFFIDDFASFTEDKGAARGHIISDKAPGMSFLALPAVSLAVKILRLSNHETQWIEQPAPDRPHELSTELKWVQWIATLSTSALYTALAVVVLFRSAILLGVSRNGALFAAIAYGFATPALGWATTFFSHATCGAFMVFGFGAIVATTMPAPDEWSIPKAFTAGVGAGVLLGIVVVLELTAAPAVICIAAYGVWRSLLKPHSRTIALIAGAVAGGFIAGTPMMAHNFILFDNPFSVGYSHSIVPPGFDGSSIDFAAPNPFVAAKVLFSGGRGLAWLSPLLLLTPIAWVAMWQARARATMVLCIAVFVAFLLVNASYANWYAGASTGPRYIAPALPFLALPFGWLWDQSKAAARWAMMGLAIVSMTLCFAMASIQMFSPWDYQRQRSPAGNVVLNTLLPKLAKQDLPNLVAVQLGTSPRLALLSYAFVVGGGLLVLCFYSGSLSPARRNT